MTITTLSEKQIKNGYKQFLLFVLSLCNLLIMHYYIFSTCNIEAVVDFTSYVDNFYSISLEIICFFYFFYFITKKNVSITLTLLFTITLIWAFCNILYSRFFLRYITFSSIGQATNLLDWDMIECVIDGLRWIDLYFVIVPLIYLLVHKTCSFSSLSPKAIHTSIISFFFILLIDLMAHALFCLTDKNLHYASYYIQRVYGNHIETDHNFGRPNWANFHRGSIRTLLAETIIVYGNKINLDEEKITQINKVINKNKNNNSNRHELLPEIKNIIFILVESYVSFATDLKIEGQEIMPFLNSLKKEQNVFYNDSMCSNITLGQSSDGQFIYMSGLLPLRSVITISQAKNKILPGLPRLLKKQTPTMFTQMIIPTLPSLWEQEAMCNAYGFDKLYSSNDYYKNHSRNLTDKEVFELASEVDKSTQQPFFSIILTMTMHSPYNKKSDYSFQIKDKKYSNDFICYLNACHYTDKQIKKYFSHLKETGLYDNSLIIIASDHQVLENFLDVERYGYDRHLPLFIINGNINQGQGWKGECNQLDVYPTILNLINARSKWYGLGSSILSPEYKSSINNNMWDISEWIIFGDYFNNHPY